MSNETKALWATARFVAMVFAIAFSIMALIKFVPIDFLLIGAGSCVLFYLVYLFYRFNLEHFNSQDEIEKIRSK